MSERPLTCGVCGEAVAREDFVAHAAAHPRKKNLKTPGNLPKAYLERKVTDPQRAWSPDDELPDPAHLARQRRFAFAARDWWVLAREGSAGLALEYPALLAALPLGLPQADVLRAAYAEVERELARRYPEFKRVLIRKEVPNA